jgi:hypothetical protein
MATYSNLFVDQGADFSYTLNLASSLNDAFDLSNCTARGQIKRNYAALTAVDFTLTIDASAEDLAIELNAIQTKAMKPTRYVYDIELVSNDVPAVVIRVLEGQLEVTPSVTSA